MNFVQIIEKNKKIRTYNSHIQLIKQLNVEDFYSYLNNLILDAELYTLYDI